jgi:hypothetical protein
MELLEYTATEAKPIRSQTCYVSAQADDQQEDRYKEDPRSSHG